MQFNYEILGPMIGYLDAWKMICLRQDKEQKAWVWLQLLQAEVYDPAKRYQRIVLSDAVFMYPALVIPDMVNFVWEKLYNLSVVRVYTGYNQEKHVYIIYDIQLMLRRTLMIGQPFLFGFINNVQQDDNLRLIQKCYFTDENLTQIRQLNQYLRKTKIFGQVLLKMKKMSNLQDCQNTQSFKCILADETAQILVIFQDQSCQEFHDQIQVNSFYFLENFKIEKNGKFSNNFSQHSISINQQTIIKKIDFKTIQNNLSIQSGVQTLLKDVMQLEQDMIVFIIGIVMDIQQISALQKINGQTKKLRRITIRDENQYIQVQLWNELADIQIQIFDFIQLDYFKVNRKQNNLYLQSTKESQIRLNNDCQQNQRYQELEFYKNFVVIEAQQNSYQNLIMLNNSSSSEILLEFKSSQQINELLKQNNVCQQKTYFIGHFVMLESMYIFYQCLKNKCLKQVSISGPIQYKCPVCGYQRGKPNAWLLTKIILSDDLGTININANGPEVCDNLFNLSENQLIQLQQQNAKQIGVLLKKNSFQELKVILQIKMDKKSSKKNITLLSIEKASNNFE